MGSCGADDRTPEHGGQEANLERSPPDRDESVRDAEEAKVVGDQGNQGNDESTRYGARREGIDSVSASKCNRSARSLPEAACPAAATDCTDPRARYLKLLALSPGYGSRFARG